MPDFLHCLSSVPSVGLLRRRVTTTGAINLMLVLLAPMSYAGAPFVTMANFPSGGAAQYTAAADVNRDGKEDVLASNLNGVISLLMGNGNGSFQAPKTIVALPAGAYPIVTADFNRDGNADLAVLEPGKASVLIYFGKGDGTFESAKTIPVGNSPTYIVVGDVNGDGYPDLIFSASKGTGSNIQVGFTLLLSKGSGNFHAPAFVLAKNGGAGGAMAAWMSPLAMETAGRKSFSGMGTGLFANRPPLTMAWIILGKPNFCSRISMAMANSTWPSVVWVIRTLRAR